MVAEPRAIERIIADPKIMAGKPTIRGTRIPVHLVLAHLAENPDLDDLFAAYPRLTIDDVKACLAYAQRLVESDGAPAMAGPRRRSARAAS